MKHLARLLSLLVLVSAGFFLTNCGGDDGGDKKSEEEIQFGKLKFTWNLESATFDGDDDGAAAPFNDATMSLIISGTFSEGGKYGYSFTSDTDIDASPWPAAGSWKFGSPVTSKILRLDSENVSTEADVQMSYTLANEDKSLTITIEDYDGSGWAIPGRVKSVAGDWVFTFSRP